MARGGKAKSNDTSERRCIVTGEVQPKQGLIRFVITPDGMVVPDILEKLPGRGAWVTADAETLSKANRGGFARGFKQPVTVPDDLVAMVDHQLARRVIDLLAMARKAGLTTAGFERVKAWLSGSEHIRALFQASDGSERGKGKFWTPEGARYFDCLTADELGMAFGRQTVIHCALASGRLSDRVVEEATKLKGLRENVSGQGPARKE